MGTPQNIGKGLDLFRTLVFDNAVEAAIATYEGSIYSIPIIGSIVKEIEVDFADYLYNQLAGVIVLQSVMFVDVQHRQAFDEAQTGLKAIALKYGLDSKEFQDAHEEEKQKLKKFGQFNIIQP